jgi:hypothetical protein
MNAVLRFDLEDNARKMNQLINAKSSLVPNEEKSLISNLSLARHLPRDVREKIMGLTHKDKDKNKEILKTLVGEYKFSRLMEVELRYYDFMQRFIEVLKLAETSIRLAGCECILDKFREISELDDAGIYQGFTQASQVCIDSEANTEMKKLEKYLCETLVISLNEQTGYYDSPISRKDFNQLITNTWWMFHDTIFLVLDALSKINNDNLAHERFIKNLNLRELIPEHQGGRKSRKRHYRNKRRVNTRKHSRHGKHHRRK